MKGFTLDIFIIITYFASVAKTELLMLNNNNNVSVFKTI